LPPFSPSLEGQGGARGEDARRDTAPRGAAPRGAGGRTFRGDGENGFHGDFMGFHEKNHGYFANLAKLFMTKTK